MLSNTLTTSKLAVLIDEDNTQPSKLDLVLPEVAKYGTAFIKRAYGDWTGRSLTAGKTTYSKIQYSRYSSLHTLQYRQEYNRRGHGR